ncbi:MAG: hypothetical protein PGN08_12845 [Sphingomonas taxi]
MVAALLLAGVSTGAPLLAQQPAPRTVQQDFEAAETLSAGSTPAEQAAALAAWEALEKRVGAKPRSRGIVLLRKSRLLFALDRYDEAVAAAHAGLALLPPGDATLKEDRYGAHLNLAGIAQLGLDYATAANAYRQAEQEASSPQETLAALRGLIRSATFTDPATAAAAVTRADALLATVKVDGPLAADFASARSLLALNTGDLPRATAEAKAAVKLLGGLTTRTDLRDVAARSDAALALLLSGRKDEAREYMAMTGAGRVPQGKFDLGAAMTPPDCGGEGNLKPDDLAVVQFSVADDGSVLIAEPIYAAGGRAVALAFARAVRQWAWTVEQVQAMPKFLRYNTRVELRCNMAFPRPSIDDGLMGDLTGWIAAQGTTVPDEPENPAQALPGQRAVLAAASARGDAMATLAALVALIRSPVLPRDERTSFAVRALQIAQARNAPVTGQLALDLAARVSDSADEWRLGWFRRMVTPILEQAPYAGDPRARAALRLILADRERSGSDRVAALLDQVANDPALPAGDALRTGAQIRLASLAQQRGDEAAARAAFAKTGLTASQCALVGDSPKMLRAGGTFPEEAINWHFEGWTRTQFDIAANGRVQNARAIVSYPPFIFTSAGADTASGLVFAKTYRPAGALACGASLQTIRFAMPN